jgi:hypothetical protein
MLHVPRYPFPGGLGLRSIVQTILPQQRGHHLSNFIVNNNVSLDQAFNQMFTRSTGTQMSGGFLSWRLFWRRIKERLIPKRLYLIRFTMVEQLSNDIKLPKTVVKQKTGKDRLSFPDHHSII